MTDCLMLAARVLRFRQTGDSTSGSFCVDPFFPLLFLSLHPPHPTPPSSEILLHPLLSYPLFIPLVSPSLASSPSAFIKLDSSSFLLATRSLHHLFRRSRCFSSLNHQLTPFAVMRLCSSLLPLGVLSVFVVFAASLAIPATADESSQLERRNPTFYEAPVKAESEEKTGPRYQNHTPDKFEPESAQDDFWMSNVKHQGVATFNPNKAEYKVYRDVKACGAKG